MGRFAPGPSDYSVVAYDAETAVWSSRYDGAAGFGGSIDVARAVGVSPDGQEVHVTGFSGVTASWKYWGFDLQPPFIRLPSGMAAAAVVLDATTGTRMRVARFNPAVAGEGGAFGYRLASEAALAHTHSPGSPPQGAVDSSIHFACGSVLATCLPAERNLDDYAVLAYRS